MLAGGALVGLVVALDNHAVGADAELLEAVAWVDEHTHASHGCEQRAAVDGERIGVVGWNHTVVVGIAAIEQAAPESEAGAAEGGVFRTRS